VRDGWSPTAEHEVIVGGPAAPWMLEYLELATYHGATRDYDLLIVPASSSSYTRLPFGWIALVWMALRVAFLLPSPALPRWLSVLYRTLCGLIALLFVLAVVSRVVSPYAVLLSRAAFTSAVFVLLAPRVWLPVRWAFQAGPRRALE
jgi:hypothetical protein